MKRELVGGSSQTPKKRRRRDSPPTRNDVAAPLCRGLDCLQFSRLNRTLPPSTDPAALSPSKVTSTKVVSCVASQPVELHAQYSPVQSDTLPQFTARDPPRGSVKLQSVGLFCVEGQGGRQ